MYKVLRTLRWLLCGVSFGVGAASQPPLWLLEKGTEQIWLLGSIHVGRDAFYPLPPAVTRAFAQAEQLIVEVDLRQRPDRDTGMMEQRARLPAGQQLSQRLPAEDYRQLEQAARQWGIPMTRLTSYHPWFIALLLEQTLYQRQGFTPSQGIDQHFIDLAMRQQLPITALETVADQVASLASLEPYEVAFLKATLNELEQLPEQFDLLVEHWQHGDLDALAQLLLPLDASPEGQAITEILLHRRNRNWVEQLVRPSPYSRRLVVVGALHLPGPQGLIALLTEQGWQASGLNGR